MGIDEIAQRRAITIITRIVKIHTRQLDLESKVIYR